MPNVQSPLASGPKVPLAGIIAAPLPKVTPPSSLNVAPPVTNLTLSTPFTPPSNPLSLLPTSPPQTQLIGLNGPPLTQQAPTMQPITLAQSPQPMQSNTVSRPARAIASSPVYDL